MRFAVCGGIETLCERGAYVVVFVVGNWTGKGYTVCGGIG